MECSILRGIKSHNKPDIEAIHIKYIEDNFLIGKTLKQISENTNLTVRVIQIIREVE